MDITTIIAKAVEGTALTTEEAAYAKAYKAPEPGDSIPRSRLNEEIEKRKGAEAAAAKAAADLAAKVKELELQGLTEREKMERELTEKAEAAERRAAELAAEKDRLSGELGAKTRAEQIRRLADDGVQGNRFKYPEFLDTQLAAANVDPADTALVASFMSNLLTKMPEMFVSEQKPGSNTAPGAGAGMPKPTDVSKMGLEQKAEYIRIHGKDAYVKNFIT